MVYGQECSSRWITDLGTDPFDEKFFLGDTSAGYAAFSYWADPDLVLEIKGEFPHARFFSIESQDTQFFLRADHLLDHEIAPDPGSTNPFTEGNPLDVEKRTFTVRAMQDKPLTGSNLLELPKKGLTQSIMVRIYSPNDGLKLSTADLPSIRAFDRRTGKERACPLPARYLYESHFPQFLADAYVLFKPGFEFKLPPETNAAGQNAAASYLLAVTQVAHNEVALMRFIPPTYMDTQSGKGTMSLEPQVRYWSMCAVNFPRNTTNFCFPDRLSSVQDDGFQYIVVGKGEGVKKAAEERGYSFVPDTRKLNQNVFGFLYRNLVARKDFQETHLFKGDYKPQTMKCSNESFIDGSCGW